MKNDLKDSTKTATKAIKRGASAAGRFYTESRAVPSDYNETDFYDIFNDEDDPPSEAETSGAKIKRSIGRRPTLPVLSSTFDVPGDPVGVAVSPDTATAYVSHRTACQLTVIQTHDARVVATVSLSMQRSGSGWNSAAVTPDGSLVYATDSASGYVLVIDSASNRVIGRIKSGKDPRSVVISPDGKTILVANAGSRSLSVIRDGSERVDYHFRVGKKPIGVTFVPHRGWAYVTSYASNSLYLVNHNTGGVLAWSGLRHPTGLAIDGPRNRLYIASQGTEQCLQILSTYSSRIVGRAPTGSLPTSVAMDPTGELIYVSDRGSKSISLISAQTHRLLKTLKTGKAPYGLAVAGDGRLFVAVPKSESILVFAIPGDGSS